MGLWERICGALVELEGASDAEESPGAWHVTRHPNGIAGFLLNGNAAHRYAPQTSITAQSLARIADQCAAQSPERTAEQSAAQSPERTAEQSAAQSSERIAEQCAAQSPERTAEQSAAQSSERTAEQSAEAS